MNITRDVKDPSPKAFFHDPVQELELCLLVSNTRPSYDAIAFQTLSLTPLWYFENISLKKSSLKKTSAYAWLWAWKFFSMIRSQRDTFFDCWRAVIRYQFTFIVIGLNLWEYCQVTSLGRGFKGWMEGSSTSNPTGLPCQLSPLSKCSSFTKTYRTF